MLPLISNKQNANTAVVYYHKGCPDGFAAAMAAYYFMFNGGYYRNVYAIPTTYGTPGIVPAVMLERDTGAFLAPIEGVAPKFDVYFVDFCPAPAELETILQCSEIANITVLDHHQKTLDNMPQIKKVLKQKTGATFNMYFSYEHSGASLTYEFFKSAYPNVAENKDLVSLVDYVRTYDLWEHNGNNHHPAASVAVGLGHIGKSYVDEYSRLNCVPSVFDASNYDHVQALVSANTNAIARLVETSLHEIQSTGFHYIRANEEAAGELIQEAMVYNNIAIVGGVSGELVNEVANQLKMKYRHLDFAVAFECREKGIKVSLRAGSVPTTDLNKLASLIYDGGGHPAAAGCMIPYAGATSEQALTSVRKHIEKAMIEMGLWTKGEE